MFLTKLRIRKFKCLESFDLTLDELEPLTLLYGPNGIGKSTVLEIASLLGHLPVIGDVELSALGAGTATWRNLDEWFEAPTSSGKVCFSLSVNSIHGGVPFNVYLLVKTKSYGDTETPLTSLLSSRHTDEELSSVVSIVVDDSNRDFVAALLEMLKRGRTPRREGGIVVTYINTDLNDFGRGNDLRESPKNLLDDFVHEMRDRLELPFPPPTGEFKYKDDLNTIFARVLSYAQVYGLPGVIPSDTALELAECRIDTSNKFRLVATRLISRFENTPLSFMSAGENECFFVFSLLLGLPLKGGLVLLDEPDLHISTPQKRAFFSELYKRLMDAGCQAIIATHSEYALIRFNVGYRVMRLELSQDGGDIRTIADNATNLRLAHSAALFWRALQALAYGVPFGWELLKSAFDMPSEKFNLTFWLSTVTAVLLIGAATIPGVLDLWMLLTNQPPEKHEKLASLFWDFAAYSLLVALGALVVDLGVKLRKRRQSARIWKQYVEKRTRRKK